MIVCCVQQSAGQIRNRKSGTSGSKSSERGETVTFADIAGVDEAKEELEEIVVGRSLLLLSAHTFCMVFQKLFINYCTA